MAHAVLVEKGAAHRVEWLSFAKGEHKTPAMLARNPRGTIPVLTDGAISVHETLAILQYLEHRLADPPLWLHAAPALALTRLHESASLKDAGMALFVALMRDADADDLWDALRSELVHWERYLSAHAFVAGEAITLADFCVFTYLATAVELGLELDASSALAGFYARMRARPSIVATWPTTWGAA